jgi:hypothetical protein
MTWQKLGSEFWLELHAAQLSADAKVTHAEAIGYLYRLERSPELFIERHMLRQAVTSDTAESAISELIGAKFWRPVAGGWVIVHHEEVIRQSIAAQVSHRETEKDRQRSKRAAAKKAAELRAKKKAADLKASSTPRNVGTNVRTNVGTNDPPNVVTKVGATQTYIQTSIQDPTDQAPLGGGGIPEEDWPEVVKPGTGRLIEPDEDPEPEFDDDPEPETKAEDTWESGNWYAPHEMAGGQR